jgi:hypothetical protein
MLVGLSAVGVATISQARETIVLEDFESPTPILPLTGTKVNGPLVIYSDLADNIWRGRNNGTDTADWQILNSGHDGFELSVEDSNNKSTQCGAAFRVDFSGGVNFALEFDAPRGVIWNDFDIVIGKDAGTNAPTQRLMQVAQNQTFIPDDSAVEGSWLHLINNGWNFDATVIATGSGTSTHCSIDFNAEGNLPADLADYDLMMIRLQCSTGGRAAYDNFELTYDPPPVPLKLAIEESGGNLTFRWDGKFGKVYDILTSSDLAGDPSSWTPLISNIPATLPTNTELHTWTGGTKAFFVVSEKAGPPIFSDDFETDKGWTNSGPGGDAPGTTWERGVPTAPGGPTAAHSLANCYATNLASDYTLNADVWLRSPPIDLTDPGITGAKLSFSHFLEMEAGFDFGFVRVIDAVTNLPLGADLLDPQDGLSIAWEELVDLELPPEAIGNLNPVKIEFRLVSDDLFADFSGWAIDDVSVSVE